MASRAEWEAKWASEDFAPRWGDRGIPPELVDAVRSGWLPALGPVLDIGCGVGEIAAWFAKQGYEALGFDIAPSAVERARRKHAPLPAKLEFLALDACEDLLPNRQFRILIDRGCLHTLAPEQAPRFANNIRSVATVGARMMLFMRAFRGRVNVGDPRWTEQLVTVVSRVFAGTFEVLRYGVTYLDRFGGADPAHAMPGMLFWLEAI